MVEYVSKLLTMESYYPKFGEVELVLVEDDNDFYDPLETNFECEDENEDNKLQLNDAIHEENQFNLEIDDVEQERTASPPPIPEEQHGHGKQPTIKQESPDQNYDFVPTATASNTAGKNGPIATPKFERDIEMSDDSLDAYESHFNDNDSNHEDSTPIETKPNLAELQLQDNEKTAQQSKRIEKVNSSIEMKDEDDRRVGTRRTVRIDTSKAPGDAKTKNRSKPKSKTKSTTSATAIDTTVADSDAGDGSSSKEDATNTEDKCKKKRPKRESAVRISMTSG